MKTIYLVRHGESVGNAEGVFKDPQAELIELGHKQAEVLAKRCVPLKIERVIASPNKRAVQTAEYISKACNVSLDLHDSFAAIKYASKMQGKSKLGKEADEYTEILKQMYAKNPEERYEDAENFNDLIKRFQVGFDFLALQPEEALLVVTHQSILKSLVVHALLEGRQTIEQHVSTKKTLADLDHNGITEIKFSRGRWQLVTWNDRSFFAE